MKIFISPFKGGTTSVAVALGMIGFKRWDSTQFLNSDNWAMDFKNLHIRKELSIKIKESNSLVEGFKCFNEITKEVSSNVDYIIGKSIKELFGSYCVADDYPLGHETIHPFVKKIVFKDEAKFIFLERPMDEYLKSVKSHLLNRKYKHIYNNKCNYFCKSSIGNEITIENFKSAKQIYIGLKNTFPNDVLIMNLEDEWPPLASFLGFDVPDVEFPRFNVSVSGEDPCVSCCSCEHEYLYCEKYDSDYCPVCLEWRDDTCGEEKCTICKKRPDKPIDS